ncbi:MAG: hypothetical protein JWO59_3453, partial [Chloroflexi bacterium]|nr:hypothetical protein [Chloroflexota bacterium]
TLEKRYLRKDGQIVWGQLAVSVTRDRSGTPHCIIGLLLDVTERRAAEQQLQRSETQYRRIVETAQEGVWQLDADGRTTFANQAMAGLLGTSVGEMQGASVYSFIAPGDVAATRARLASREQGIVQHAEVCYRRKDGSSVHTAISANPLFTAEGDYLGALALVTDITERKRMELDLRASEARFRALVQHASDVITVLDAAGNIVYQSPAITPLMGYDADDIGSTIFTRIHPDDASAAQAAFAHCLSAPGQSVTIELRSRHRDGSWRYLEVVGTNQIHEPAIRGVILNTRDITERKQAEAALRHQAMHDSLTDLPNRVLVHEHLGTVLAVAQRTVQPVGLLLLDLDRFKEVNDSLGHHIGDLLLRQVATRLKQALGATETIARLGGDEFAIILPAADAAGSTAVAQLVLSALEPHFQVEQHLLDLGGSIGIAVYPEHGNDVQALLRHADVAMYVAKRAHGGAAMYDPVHDQHMAGRLLLSHDLREAIRDQELLLYYQPKVALATGQVCGVEVLLRWPHRVHGFIPPIDFIPLAEENGMILPLTDWVLATALAQSRTWQTAGHNFTIAVNVSTRSLQDPRFPEAIARLLAQQCIAPRALTLEITESTIMADPIRAMDVLTQLHAMGVHLSIDDFGTGFSSLGYLKALPVDEVKIDKSFVLGMGTGDQKDAAIVRSVVAMAHELGLTVVAEGVEDAATYTLLGRLGCDIVQGYYLSRPQSVEGLEAWLGTASLPSGRMLAHSS